MQRPDDTGDDRDAAAGDVVPPERTLDPATLGRPAAAPVGADAPIETPQDGDDWGWALLTPPLPMLPGAYGIAETIENETPAVVERSDRAPFADTGLFDEPIAACISPVAPEIDGQVPDRVEAETLIEPADLSEPLTGIEAEVLAPVVTASDDADIGEPVAAVAVMPSPVILPSDTPPPKMPLSDIGPAALTAFERRVEPTFEPTKDPAFFDQPAMRFEVPQAETPRPPDRQAPPAPKTWRALAARTAKIAAIVVGAWFAAILLLIAAYRFVDPPLSSLMVQQRLSGLEITQDWVALDDISPEVVRAVMLSEDGRFCTHSGIDLEEMQNAIERAGDGGVPRGASTISMQVIKNLFLWPSKSYVRKAVEIPLTFVMEFAWPKSRIMEVYLNIAEWGPGVFGVEAASQFHFNKSARQLNEREAARLAVALPNPILRDAGDPGPRTRRLASDIQARMRAASLSQTACAMPARRVVPRAQPRPEPKSSPRPQPRAPRPDDDQGGWDPFVSRE